MKIASSAVAMSSERAYASYTEVKSRSVITTAEQAATLQFSKEGGDLLKQMADRKEELAEQRKKQQEQAARELLPREQTETEHVRWNGNGSENRVKNPYELKLEILRKMFEALKRVQKGEHLSSARNEIKLSHSMSANVSAGVSISAGTGIQAGITGNTGTAVSPGSTGGTGWVKTTVNSAFVAEAEYTAYQAAGVARTEDGREISFGVTVEMSRAFCQKYESFVQEDYICTDPLVINLDKNVASVTEQKFLFDLDADGKEEEISFAGAGSGFLALDRNGDGKINDGSELFGTRSGNGFADLAQYDKDGNGWIDENDDVFYDLKIWTKDEDGRNRLLSLKEADVGAIYLGYADTEFSLNESETNRKDGIIRSTGVYLKESGGAGTVQHVDLVL